MQRVVLTMELHSEPCKFFIKSSPFQRIKDIEGYITGYRKEHGMTLEREEELRNIHKKPDVVVPEQKPKSTRRNLEYCDQVIMHMKFTDTGVKVRVVAPREEVMTKYYNKGKLPTLAARVRLMHNLGCSEDEIIAAMLKYEQHSANMDKYNAIGDKIFGVPASEKKKAVKKGAPVF